MKPSFSRVHKVWRRSGGLTSRCSRRRAAPGAAELVRYLYCAQVYEIVGDRRPSGHRPSALRARDLVKNCRGNVGREILPVSLTKEE
jgi:hypothetical protein